jgi:hypothetical protein
MTRTGFAGQVWAALMAGIKARVTSAMAMHPAVRWVLLMLRFSL